MIALRRGATELSHEDYMDGEHVLMLHLKVNCMLGILEVQAKKKTNLVYYA